MHEHYPRTDTFELGLQILSGFREGFACLNLPKQTSKNAEIKILSKIDLNAVFLTDKFTTTGAHILFLLMETPNEGQLIGMLPDLQEIFCQHSLQVIMIQVSSLYFYKTDTYL